MSIYVITGNKGKFAEVSAILPDVIQLDIELPEIQSTNPEEIIKEKLKVARTFHDGAFIVEDTGLYIDSLHGLPGPLIKWFLKHLGTTGLADLALKYESQKAKAITWIGYAPNSEEMYFFEGGIDGTIVAPRGEGFGWDPVFQPKGSLKTFGEMESTEKNQISMRRNALEKLKSHLTTHSN